MSLINETVLTFLLHAPRLRTLQGLILRSAKRRAEDRNPLAGEANEIDDIVLASHFTPELI